jgi:hypothetical protein
MNKRLVEIHNQTMYWVADNGNLRISDRLPSGYTEKLAELIVRECASLAYDGPGGILEHFGVEQ